MSAKVSVIVPIYNGADVLPITVPPLLNQDYPRELTEIILVDDGSTDGTAKLLQNPQWKKRCKIVHHPENRGRAATRNSGIEVATGELLIFLDCDIEVEPDFISQHVALHRNDKITGVISHISTREPHSKDKYHRYIFFSKRGARVVGSGQPLPFNYFIIGCSSIKAHALSVAGRFNEELPAYGEDIDFAYRLWKTYPSGLIYSSKIIVYMHEVKTLDETLVDFREFGRYNVPIIVRDFPELAPYVGADFVVSPGGRKALKTVSGSLLINRAMASLARILLTLTPYPLSNQLIRYLLLSQVTTGYRESLKIHG